MTFQKCFFCNKFLYAAYQVTEVDKNGQVESISLCKKCGLEYIKTSQQAVIKSVTNIDLTQLDKTSDLVALISEICESLDGRPLCTCGWTEADFSKHGRMGCPKCYEFFTDKLESYVFPYHGARQHVGKRPKRQIQDQIMDNPIEKLKLLKLLYAQALELEKYEKAAEIKVEIDQITQTQDPTICEDL